ncbi:MAG: D-aminoacyl-tRNA deacylase [Ilumatobacteraceae bacterium]
MRALVQRVARATVTSRPSADAAWETSGSIGAGLCAFVGATHADTAAEADRLADKLWGLRIFDDDDGVMNRSVADVGGQVLVVSQFTLYGDTAKGRRPSWIAAARPDVAEPLVDRVVEALRGLGATVATGRFRTDMQVDLVNDGPVTLMLEIDPPAR